MYTETIQHYDAITEKLQYPQADKIHKIIEKGCLVRIHEDLWVCNPIAGYNSTAYSLKRNSSGKFSCNCQGHNKRGYCSHSNALNVILSDQEKELQGVLF
jgi:hypothetical protein